MKGHIKHKKNSRAGKRCITMIALVFVAVMSIQIVRVYEKDQEYIQKEAALREQLQDEEERQASLEEYQDYMQSSQYVENVAKSKLGMAYENEIIFKETKAK